MEYYLKQKYRYSDKDTYSYSFKGWVNPNDISKFLNMDIETLAIIPEDAKCYNFEEKHFQEYSLVKYLLNYESNNKELQLWKNNYIEKQNFLNKNISELLKIYSKEDTLKKYLKYRIKKGMNKFAINMNFKMTQYERVNEYPLYLCKLDIQNEFAILLLHFLRVDITTLLDWLENRKCSFLEDKICNIYLPIKINNFFNYSDYLRDCINDNDISYALWHETEKNVQKKVIESFEHLFDLFCTEQYGQKFPYKIEYQHKNGRNLKAERDASICRGQMSSILSEANYWHRLENEYRENQKYWNSDDAKPPHFDN